MNIYHIKRAEGPLTISSPDWKYANIAQVDCFPWDKDGYQPNTKARVMYSDEGLTVKMETDEKPLLSRFTENNDPVYTDSCMEFFFKPNQGNPSYFNFEFNPNGTLLLGFGTGRGNTTRQNFDSSIFEIESIIDNIWQLKFFIPFSFVSKYIDGFSNKFSGNFYKCGDETVHPHWGCWNKIETAEPDFHRPEFFGELIFD